jgi:anti-sigma-K factor RskA
MLAVLGGGGFAHLELRREAARLRAERAAAAERATALGGELAAAEREVDRLRLAVEILAAPELRPVVLAGLEPTPGAAGHTFLDARRSRALFVARDLPPAPAGKTYQLWFIASGRPFPAGVFDADPGGTALVLVEGVAPAGEIQAWAVTIEPAGGVPQPTGEMVLKG